MVKQAYATFASGDAEADAKAFRRVLNAYPHIPVLLAQSFAKNFGKMNVITKNPWINKWDAYRSSSNYENN